jgi:hypothetical protein
MHRATDDTYIESREENPDDELMIMEGGLSGMWSESCQVGGASASKVYDKQAASNDNVRSHCRHDVDAFTERPTTETYEDIVQHRVFGTYTTSATISRFHAKSPDNNPTSHPT